LVGNFFAIFTTKFNPKRALVFSSGLSEIGFILTILMVKLDLGLWGVVGSRIFAGLFEGLYFPTLQAQIVPFLTKKDGTLAVTFIYGAEIVGTAISLSVSPLLISWFGWEGIILVYFILAFSITISFGFLMKTNPFECQNHLLKILRPNEMELKLFVHQRDHPHHHEHHSINWKKISKSKPFYSLMLAHFAYNYSYYFLMSWLPTYLKDQFSFDLKSTGFLSMLPFCGMFLFGLISGKVADYAIEKKIRTVVVRRIFNFISLLIPASSLFLLLLTNDKTISLAIIIVFESLIGCANAGYTPNFGELSPKSSGTVMALSNTTAQIPGVVGLSLVGFLLDSTHSWFYPFVFNFGVCLIGATVFSFFISSEEQF